MIKLVHCTKISAEFEVGGHSSSGCTPPKCGVGLRLWENQRINAGCLVK